MERRLRLTGKGEASKAPDRIQIALSVSAENRDYNKAIEECDKRVMNLKDNLTRGGFNNDDIKTTDFRVRTITKYVEERKSGRYVFDRYSVVHSLVIKFPFDKKNLANCVDIITKSLAEPNFSISFTVEDSEELKDEALANAVSEAKHRGELLAKSAGVSLGNICLIDHSFSQINVYAPRNYDYHYEGAVMAKTSSSASMESINVENVKITANVTIEWEIK